MSRLLVTSLRFVMGRPIEFVEFENAAMTAGVMLMFVVFDQIVNFVSAHQLWYYRRPNIINTDGDRLSRVALSNAMSLLTRSYPHSFMARGCHTWPTSHYCPIAVCITAAWFRPKATLARLRNVKGPQPMTISRILLEQSWRKVHVLRDLFHSCQRYSSSFLFKTNVRTSRGALFKACPEFCN